MHFSRPGFLADYIRAFVAEHLDVPGSGGPLGIAFKIPYCHLWRLMQHFLIHNKTPIAMTSWIFSNEYKIFTFSGNRLYSSLIERKCYLDAKTGAGKLWSLVSIWEWNTSEIVPVHFTELKIFQIYFPQKIT